jgi:hypothetical protein
MDAVKNSPIKMHDGTRNNQGSFYAHHSSSTPVRYFKNRNYPSTINVAKGVMKGIVLLSTRNYDYIL